MEQLIWLVPLLFNTGEMEKSKENAHILYEML